MASFYVAFASGAWLLLCPGRCALRRTAEADTEEDFEDAGGGFERGVEVAGYFGFATDAAAVVDGDLEDAELMLGCLDLHLEVPAVGELGHAELREGGAADGAEGAHVRIADALEEAKQEADKVGGEELRREHGSGLAAAADTGADHEVSLVAEDGIDEAGEIVNDVGAVAIHVDEDVRRAQGGEGAGEAGIAIAAGAGYDSGAGGGCNRRGGVSGAVIDDDAFGDLRPGHGTDDVADGFGLIQGGNDYGERHWGEFEDTGRKIVGARQLIPRRCVSMNSGIAKTSCYQVWKMIR